MIGMIGKLSIWMGFSTPKNVFRSVGLGRFVGKENFSKKYARFITKGVST